MKVLVSVLLSVLLISNPAFALLMRSDGVNWDNVERLKVSNNQLTKLGEQQYLIETGNGNRLANPNFLAVPYSTGWVVNTATPAEDNTFYFNPSKSLQLTLPSGSQTNLDFLSQTYTANSGDLAGGNLEVAIRLAKNVFQAGVTMQLCLDINAVQKNCYTIPKTTAATYFEYYGFNYPALQTTSPVTYRVYLRASYSGIVGPAAIINVQDAYFGPARNIGQAGPPNVFTAFLNSSGATNQTPNPWVNCSLTGSTGGVGYTCTFNNSMSGLSSIPSCGFNVADGTGVVNEGRVSSISTSGVSIYSNAASTYTRLNGLLTCTKTGSNQSQSAISISTMLQAWSGSITGGGWTTTANTYGDFSAGTGITLTPIKSENISVTAISGSLPGITFTPNFASKYYVCANGVVRNGTSGQASLVRLVDGSGNVINQGTKIDQNNASFDSSFSLCGILDATSTSPVSIKIQGRSSTGGSTTTLTSNDPQFPTTFTIVQITQGFPSPILTGSVVYDTAIRAEKSSGPTSVDYGTYSATVTAGTNAAPVTSPTTCNFSRIGTTVNVSCHIPVGCTTASGTNTEVTVSLPTATVNALTVAGTMGFTVVGESGRVIGSGSKALAQFACNIVGSYSRLINFQYQTQ